MGRLCPQGTRCERATDERAQVARAGEGLAPRGGGLLDGRWRLRVVGMVIVAEKLGGGEQGRLSRDGEHAVGLVDNAEHVALLLVPACT